MYVSTRLCTRSRRKDLQWLTNYILCLSSLQSFPPNPINNSQNRIRVIFLSNLFRTLHRPQCQIYFDPECGICIKSPNSILDVDECALGTASCSQTCTNNVGSFQCGCTSGYRLQADGKSCSGRPVNIYQIYIIFIYIDLFVDQSFPGFVFNSMFEIYISVKKIF